MIKFNAAGKPEEELTFGDILGPAMEITEQANADEYLRDYIACIERALIREPNTNGYTAKQIAKTNLGYYAGYYSDEVQQRVNRLFRTTHPIFGNK